jgi:hypothetical protein
MNSQASFTIMDAPADGAVESQAASGNRAVAFSPYVPFDIEQ